MAHYRDQPALIGSGEEACIVRRSLGTGDAVAFPVQHDGRDRDFGLRRQLLLDVLVSEVARGVAEPMAVGVDDDVDEIRIVERGSRALVGRVVKMPVGRSQPPLQNSPRLAARPARPRSVWK